MEGYFKIGTLVVAVLFLVFILLDTLLKRQRYKVINLSDMKLDKKSLKEPLVFKEPTCPYPVSKIDAEEGKSNLTPAFNPVTENASVTQKDEVISGAKKSPTKDDILLLMVLAKPGSSFASYDLLQAILATGLQYGEMNIFHYYTTVKKDEKLFSLASATKPGDFNLDRMGEFSCTGLTLFMDLRNTSDPEFAFNTMLNTAFQLADDLDGGLFAAPGKPWTFQVKHEYQQKITQYNSLQKYETTA